MIENSDNVSFPAKRDRVEHKSLLATFRGFPSCSYQSRDTVALWEYFLRVLSVFFAAMIGWQTSLAGQECQRSAHDVTAVYICPSCPAKQDRRSQSAGMRRKMSGDGNDETVMVLTVDLVVRVGVLWWLLIGQILRRGESPLSDLNLSFTVWRHHITHWSVTYYIILENCK